MYNHECFYNDPVTLITWTLSLSLGPVPAGLRPSCLCLKENKKASGQVGLGPGPGPEALFLLLLPKTTKYWAWTLGLGLQACDLLVFAFGKTRQVGAWPQAKSWAWVSRPRAL